MKFSKRRKNEDLEAAYSESQSLSFDQALSAFLDAQRAFGHSNETYRDYLCVIKIFLRYMTEHHNYTLIEGISEADVIGWLASLRNGTSLRGKPYSSRTIQTYQRDVATFFNWLVVHGYLLINPVSRIKTPKVEKALIRVFTEEELALLDAACDRTSKGKSITPDERKMLASRDRAILWLLLSTGIRLSELCHLRFCDLDWNNGMIVVTGKGSKERRVTIGSVARQHLNTYITYWRGTPSSTSDTVFLSVFSKAITSPTVKQVFAHLKKQAGITDKRVSAHTCRHWFAVNCIKNGMPSTVLQGLLGHEQLEMINTYVRLAEQDNKDLYVKHSPVDRLAMHQTSNVKDKRTRLREWRQSRKKPGSQK